MNEKLIQLSKELKHRPILEKALGYFPNLPLVAIDCAVALAMNLLIYSQRDLMFMLLIFQLMRKKSVLIDLKMTLNLFSIMNLLKTLISRLQA